MLSKAAGLPGRVLCGALLLGAQLSAGGNVGGVQVTARSRSLQPGELVVLTITVPKAEAAKPRRIELKV